MRGQRPGRARRLRGRGGATAGVPAGELVAARDDSTALALVVGLALGCAAFSVDQFDGVAVTLLSPVVSSSFSWGAAAVVIGYRARSPGRAVLGAVTSLAIAAGTYYLLILVYSRRWASGESGDGGSSVYSGVLSVGRALGLWLLLAGCAGVVLGLLGRQLAGNSHRRATVAGLVAGLLAGEAVHTSLFVLRHRSPDELSSFALWPVTAVVAIGGAAYVLARRGDRVAWRAFGAAVVVSLSMTTVLWSVVAGLRTAL